MPPGTGYGSISSMIRGESRRRTSRPASPASRTRYPLATIAAYGPDNTRATKLVVSVLPRPEQKYPSETRSWHSDTGDVRDDRVIAAAVADWLRSQGTKDTLS